MALLISLRVLTPFFAFFALFSLLFSLYQEGINSLQGYLDSLQKARQKGIDSNLKMRYWKKVHSTNAPSEEKEKIRKEYVLFMNMEVESRRIRKDIVLLEKLRDHFKFGNQGLYNLHYVEPEINEQLDKF